MKRSEVEVVLDLLKKGKTKAQIRKELGLKHSALSNRLRRLEDLGCIERQGKFLIKVLSTSHNHPKVTKNLILKKLNKRGHAHNIKVLFPKEQNLLDKPKVVQEFRQKKLEQLQFGSMKLTKDKNSIWINKESLTIYSNNSYYSDNALHTKFRALKEIDNLIIYLKDRFDFRGPYGIEVFREHYGLIFNKFAKWILSRGQKMYVKNRGNKTILWVDNSRKDDIGLTEFEGKDPIAINKADNFFDSHEKHDWRIDADFVLNGFAQQNKSIGQVMQTQTLFAQNIESHVGAIQKLATGVEDLTKQVKILTDLNNTQKGKV